MRAMHTMHTTSTLLRVELSAHAATLRTFAIVVAVFAAANLVMQRGDADHRRVAF